MLLRTFSPPKNAKYLCSVKSAKEIFNSIFRRGRKIPNGKGVSFLFGGLPVKRLEFASVIFLNICQLLTDLCNDVDWMLKAGDSARFYAFKKFFLNNGQRAMDLMLRDGVTVIGHTQVGEGVTAAHEFHICKNSEYSTISDMDGYRITSNVPGMDVYAMTSATFEMCGRSDASVLQPWLEFLDNVINASNTVSARLGSLVIATPSTPSGASAPVSLMDFERKDIEKEINDNYGSLAEQSQFLLLGTDMKFQTVNLAGLDQRTTEKVRMAILAISDRLKVPANQIGIIDANSSKSLSNGTELREGDFNKYQSFERLLNHTFVKFAEAMNLQVDYTIYNKPQRQTQQGI